MRPRIVTVCGLGFALLAATACLAQKQFDDAEYFKAAEKKGDTVKGVLRFDSAKKEVGFVTKGTTAFSIKYEAIKSLLYERAAKPRYTAGILIAWPLLFTKSKKHFLTFQYTDTAGTGQFAIVRLDKGNFREALATAEAETGKKVERTEER